MCGGTLETFRLKPLNIVAGVLSVEGCVQVNREQHLAELRRDIQYWKVELKRLEERGDALKALNVRRWIRSAERLCDTLRQLLNTG